MSGSSPDERCQLNRSLRTFNSRGFNNIEPHRSFVPLVLNGNPFTEVVWLPVRNIAALRIAVNLFMLKRY